MASRPNPSTRLYPPPRFLLSAPTPQSLALAPGPLLRPRQAPALHCGEEAPRLGCRRGRPESPADPGGGGGRGSQPRKPGTFTPPLGPPPPGELLRSERARDGLGRCALRSPRIPPRTAAPRRSPPGRHLAQSPRQVWEWLKRLSYDSGTPGASGRSARRPVLLLRQPWAPLPARGPARRGMVCPLLPRADLSPLTLRSD